MTVNIVFEGNTKLVRINRRAVLEFYDTKSEGNKGHVSAINALSGEDFGSGILKHYLENVMGASVDILPGNVTTGKARGFRLDKWIHATRPDGETLYQVEIKNWSAHAFGGKELAIDAPADVLAAYKKHAWNREWNEDLNQLRETKTSKVLQQMKSPGQCNKVLPLLCMWAAMHPDGEECPFFSVPLPESNYFPMLCVFSMSAYLRTLPDTYIEIEMPQTIQRLIWLNRLFAV